MKPSKTENEVGSTMKTTTRYAFVAPGAIGAIGKGRRRGVLRSLIEKENMPTKSLFPQSSDIVKQYIQEIETRKGRGQGLKSSTRSASQGMGMIHNNSMVLEKKYMQFDGPLPPSVDQVKQYTQKVEISAPGMGRGQSLKNSTVSASQGMGMIHKNSMVLEKEYMQFDSPLPSSTDQVKQYTQKV
ncbi:uncharacterized protein LOC132632434 [Lycium barbarum]|uniref:uncharacterized protein LOC132632434 n=1 Tax=Lycium barbarum TaxID=112863 RepID=UPI00293F2743|nr:uncharacterized protein LOC132632434 [Lycium barbarum]